MAIDATPTFDDNVRSLAPKLVKAGFRVGVLDPWRDSTWPEWLPEQVVILRKRSAEGIRFLLQSRVVLHTHGSVFEPREQTGQLGINLWHGMALKKVGALEGVGVKRSDWTLSTSTTFGPIMAEALKVEPDHVLNFGLPRNDVLKHPGDSDRKLARRLSGPSGFVMYLPTYRRSVKGHIRNDGAQTVDEKSEVRNFIGVLRALGFSMVIKPHPMAAPEQLAAYREVDDVHILADPDLTAADSSLYGLLGLSALLLTDYSSVAVDYLVTRKPIAFYVPDEAQYRNTRGLVFSGGDLLQLGPRFTSLADVSAGLNSVLGEERRPKSVPQLFYDAPLDGAADRLVGFIERVCNAELG